MEFSLGRLAILMYVDISLMFSKLKLLFSEILDNALIFLKNCLLLGGDSDKRRLKA